MISRISALILMVLLFPPQSARARVGGAEIVPGHRLADAMREIAAMERHITRQPGADGGVAWHAVNREQNLRAWFGEDGVRIEPRRSRSAEARSTAETRIRDLRSVEPDSWNADGAGDDPPTDWELLLTLRARGREGAMRATGEAEPAAGEASGNRIGFDRGGLDEWFVNEPAGLKQNFRIHEAPAGGRGELVIEYDLRSELRPELIPAADGPGGVGIEFLDGPGRRVAVYRDLIAEDANGVALAGRMELASGEGANHWIVRLVIDDAGAAYPVTVDPLFTGAYDRRLESDQPGSQFGTSVAAAGDVNGDGYGDVIIGAPFYDGGLFDSGAAFLYYGSASGLLTGGLPAGSSFYLAGTQASMFTGWSVAGAGDVNGDGYGDIIIGALLYDGGQSDEGAALVYLGSGAIGVLTPSGVLESDQATAEMGQSVACAGDVNGDGYDDVIVGATGYDSGQSNEGAAFVFLGGAGGIPNGNPATAHATFQSDQTNARLGVSVAGAGDVNADGYGDVIVGAFRYNGGEIDEGAAYIFHGSTAGLTSGNPATAATSLESGQSDSRFGRSVAGAGDVNGDGYADVIVGADIHNNGENDEGAAFVFPGSAAGVASGGPGSAFGILESNQASAGFGYSVAGAGDVNGDGYADVIVGARLYDNAQTDEGAAFVFCGSAAGIGNGDPTTAVALLETDQAGSQAGWSVAGAGDINGDGYADVLMGAVLLGFGQTNEGGVYVYHGGPRPVGEVRFFDPDSGVTTFFPGQDSALMNMAVAGAGDVNGDGYDDVIIGSYNYDNFDGTDGAAFVYHGGPAGGAGGAGDDADSVILSDWLFAGFGFRVAGAGDINGDGYADVLVGAPKLTNGQTQEGAVLILAGSASGIPSGNVSMTGVMLESDQAGADFGMFVSGAGDVNGDGYSDIIVLAPRYDSGQPDEGAAFIWLGSAAGIAPGNVSTASAVIVSNQTNAFYSPVAAAGETGAAVGAGDLNGDGYADIAIGMPFYDSGIMDRGAVFIYPGSASGIASGDPATAATALTSDQSGSRFGHAVAGAGDVNGDRFADLIIGAPYLSDGQTEEGAAFIYHGSGAGIASGGTADAATVLYSNSDFGLMGSGVAGAGDVNGDGFADILVGASRLQIFATSPGAAFVFHGAASGIPDSGTMNNPIQIADAYYRGALSLDYFGDVVSFVGDADGDGYSDILIGAPLYELQGDAYGQAFLFPGIRAAGLPVTARQRRLDDAAPVVIGLGSESDTGFGLAARGRTPYGRGRVRLQYEVKPFGTPFNGSGLQTAPSWADTGRAGAALNLAVTGLPADTLHHWRLRILNETSIAPFTSRSRWIQQSPDGWQLADIRTAKYNDDCADARPIHCGMPVLGSTTNASADPGAAAAACGTSVDGPGVWYFVIGTGGMMTATTCAASTNFDTKIHVFVGSCGALTCVTGNDDDASCGESSLFSTVSWISMPGTTYRIFVSGWNGAVGTFELSLTCAPPPTPTASPTPSATPSASPVATPSPDPVTPTSTVPHSPSPTSTATAGPCCPGDADNSGSFVDANDFIAVQAAFGADTGVGGPGDANCSGSFVDANDFIAVQANFGADCG